MIYKLSEKDEETLEQLYQDLLIFGAAYYEVTSDGIVRRIDPFGTEYKNHETFKK